jgi:hypothetical protein
MPKYGIATILEDCPVGYEFSHDNPPLHLTHVDSFVVELDWDLLEAKLKEQLKDFPEFATTALKDEFFGPNKDIPVTILELNTPLRKLHSLIMEVLEKEGAALKNPNFHNDGFAPHISRYGSKRVQPGDPILIKSISIGARVSDDENANHRILATIALRHTQ